MLRSAYRHTIRNCAHRSTLNGWNRATLPCQFGLVQRLCSATGAPPVKLQIVFGSQSGTAEAYASDLEFDAEELEYETELIDCNDFSAKDLANSSAPGTVTVLVMACYGEGEPTDNAKKFYNEMLDDSKTKNLDFSSSKYAIFGLGNSSCFKDHYNIVGTSLDTRLNSFGAKSVVPIGLGDASKNSAASYTAWKEQLLAEVAKMESSAADSNTKNTEALDLTATNTSSAPASSASATQLVEELTSPAPGEPKTRFNNETSMSLSTRQFAMAPLDRPIVLAKVSNVQEQFNQTDELSTEVTVDFDLTNAKPIGTSTLADSGPITDRLEAGDHIGVFAPNTRRVVERFIVSAGLSLSDLDREFHEVVGPVANVLPGVTLRQVLTWQVQLTGTVPLTCLKVLHRWSSKQGSPPLDGSTSMSVTTTHLSSLITHYDTSLTTQLPGLDIAGILDMIPDTGNNLGTNLPLAALFKALPAISPRLYSITNDPVGSPASASLLCRLMRYRQIEKKSSAMFNASSAAPLPSAPALPFLSYSQRIVSGLCSSYLCERLSPGDDVAIFFRESNFHLPRDPTTPIIMIAGGSGIAPFLSFMEARAHIAAENGISLGPAALYFGCKNLDEYAYKEQLPKYLTVVPGTQGAPMSRFVVGFSTASDENNQFIKSTNEARNKLQLNNPDVGTQLIWSSAANITDVVAAEKGVLKPLMEQGAHIYVCGGAGNFGLAVRKVVNDLALHSSADARQHLRDDNDEEAGVRELVQQKRYFEDLAD